MSADKKSAGKKWQTSPPIRDLWQEYNYIPNQLPPPAGHTDPYDTPVIDHRLQVLEAQIVQLGLELETIKSKLDKLLEIFDLITIEKS
jgi:hypothetical protein